VKNQTQNRKPTYRDHDKHGLHGKDGVTPTVRGNRSVVFLDRYDPST